MNYASAASTYASHRWALPWKLEPLLCLVAGLGACSEVAEAGCGTGDYLQALHEQFPAHHYQGFDISPEMLAEARARCPWAATLQLADANREFPAETAGIDLLYAVDVLHHLEDHARFFEEAARVLRPGRALVVLTDSAADIHARSLAKFFPTTVPINLERYPALGELEALAARSALRLASRRTVSGHIDLDGRFMDALASKALSELRLISAEEHLQGLEQVRAAKARGSQWLSQTSALTWSRA